MLIRIDRIRGVRFMLDNRSQGSMNGSWSFRRGVPKQELGNE